MSSQCASVAVNANFAPSSTILVIQIMDVIRSSETSVLARATQRSIPVDGILQQNRFQINISNVI
jgi:hypothetical protein